MMKKKSLACVFSVLLVATSGVWAESSVDAHISALQQKIQQLEERVRALETVAVKADLVDRDQSEAFADISPWVQVKLGLTPAQVTELLGKPQSTRKGAMAEYWYYSSEGKSGPYVKFMFHKVDAWRVPDEAVDE